MNGIRAGDALAAWNRRPQPPSSALAMYHAVVLELGTFSGLDEPERQFVLIGRLKLMERAIASDHGQIVVAGKDGVTG